MRRILTVILISFVLSGVVQAQIMEDGTPVYLGGGQGLRIDLPLQVGRAYTIKLKYGTFLPDAVFTLTLTAVEPGELLWNWQVSKGPLPRESGRKSALILKL